MADVAVHVRGNRGTVSYSGEELLSAILVSGDAECAMDSVRSVFAEGNKGRVVSARPRPPGPQTQRMHTRNSARPVGAPSLDRCCCLEALAGEWLENRLYGA